MYNEIYKLISIVFRYNEEDILCITDWGKKLSSYNKNGSEVINYILLFLNILKLSNNFIDFQR